MASKSAEYYRRNPEARKKKAATDKKINARPEQIKKRVESNAKVRQYKRENGSSPSSKNLDYDHAANKFISVKANRGRAGEGGRKYKRPK